MLDDLVAERRKKLEALKKAGIDPYPARVERTFPIAQALEDFAKLEKSKTSVSLTGRLRSLRDQGKIIFADLEDGSGKIQLVLKEHTLAKLEFWRSVLDMGDFVGATGILFETKRGEKSLEVRILQMAGKSLLPLPDKWEGLEDPDPPLPTRNLTLIAPPERPDTFPKTLIFSP